MTGIGIARRDSGFAALCTLREDPLQSFLFQVCGKFFRLHIRKRVFAFESQDMAARRLQPGNASRIGAIQPEQPLLGMRANRCKTLDPLFVARQRPSFEAVADTEPDVDARTAREVNSDVQP